MERSYFKNFALIIFLVIVTLLTNIQVITYNMMYFEQPLLFSAYQHVNTFMALVKHYLHPQFLELAVPFFRPSGHYLIYFLLVPLFGWHNQQAFLIVNLLFLSGCGFFIIHIYKKLFAESLGGWIAFAIFLMHPAMVMSKITIMHFDYAYLFFSLASLYFFIKFIEVNYERFISFSYLAISLLLFAIAATFKEPALMLGPVLCLYLYIYSSMKSIYDFRFWQILILIGLVTLTLFLYLTTPWGEQLYHPMDVNSWGKKWWAIKELTKIFLGLQPLAKVVAWQLTVAPMLAKIIMLIGSILVCALLFFPKVYHLTDQQKKASYFLFISAMLFLILPVGWAMAMPWHLSLTLLCLALLIGFVFEKVFTKNIIIALVILIISITPFTNNANIHLVKSRLGMPLDLNKNAFLAPPDIKEKLNDKSIILVEDPLIRNPYLIGTSRYPFWLVRGDTAFPFLREWEKGNLIRAKPIFNGNLFRMAYNMPKLREEEYPFSYDKLRPVSNEILYTWLQHFDNIFCFGYDKQGHWYDHTVAFKRNLLAEQKYRKLAVYDYNKFSQQRLKGNELERFYIDIHDSSACQMECDKLPQCKAVTMYTYSDYFKVKNECVLYSENTGAVQANINSVLFIKKELKHFA